MYPNLSHSHSLFQLMPTFDLNYIIICNAEKGSIGDLYIVYTNYKANIISNRPIQLEPGVPLPSPERLKGKILLKDKVKRQKGE